LHSADWSFERHHHDIEGDIYAFIFAQKGLMAGLGIQGNKITKIEPK
jgi:lipid-binding SYLF domain-containing protein